MTPVSIVTGFLGSGKTTLIGRLLRDPSMARTAVIVNEFGEIGIDHHLIASSDETLLALTTGCLCCAVRGDLVDTLLNLAQRRLDGTADFDRVLIETSGLADPAPILHALMTDPAIGEIYALDTVITLVDSQHGGRTLADHPEARRQAALADLLAFSKTDIATPDDALRDDLLALNQTAPITNVLLLTVNDLFRASDARERAVRLTRLPDHPKGNPFTQARHGEVVESFVLERETPLPALALTMLLEALTEHAGTHLLRVKGLIDIAEMPGRPALLHGVRHVFSPPEFLERWPTGVSTTRIVFITHRMPHHFPARLLAAIEAEVADALAQATKSRV